jgi:acetyl esterase
MSTADVSRTDSGAAPVLRYDPTAHYEVETFDVEYRRDADQPWLARIYRPLGSGPFPTILNVHGGQWKRGDRLNMAYVSTNLAASGAVVAAIDFRHLPRWHYPLSLVDINYATRWLKAHAAEFGGDARHVGGLGGSSGGHLVALSAMRPRDPRYRALPLAEAPDVDATLAYLLTCYPILDPYGRYLFAKETGRDDILAATEGYFVPWETVHEGSPREILDRGEAVELPPLQIIQGTIDKNVTPALQEAFAAAYRARGGTVEVEIFPEMPHQFVQSPGPGADAGHARMKDFIARQLAALQAAPAR